MNQNYKFTISYDGTRYYGFEHQPGQELTIQGKLETVLERMTGHSIKLNGSGRTDAGVHARGMVANAFLDTSLSTLEIMNYMNRYLPDDICVEDVRIASERFHARYNAVGKTYRYTCYYGPKKPIFDRKYVYILEKMPDINAMKKAAAYLTGQHDFKSFCGNPKFKKSSVRIVDSIEIKQSGPYITFTYHGTGFLQYMVRILTGTLLEVGFKKRTPENMLELLSVKDRTQAGFTAPAQGLCMMEVDY